MVKAVAERFNFTPAQVKEMTLYQAGLWCADSEFVEKLCRYRLMTPAVKAKMRQLEGFNPNGA